MKHIHIKHFLMFGFAVLLAGSACAAEMVHGYTNPDFGGSPLNGSYLLSNASAQNTYTAPTKPTLPTTTSATSSSSSSASSSSTALTSGQLFTQELNQLIINGLANNLVNKALGGTSSSTATPGIKTFNTGLNQVTIDTTSGSATSVTITDNATGGKTVVDIPNF